MKLHFYYYTILPQTGNLY